MKMTGGISVETDKILTEMTYLMSKKTKVPCILTMRDHIFQDEFDSFGILLNFVVFSYIFCHSKWKRSLHVCDRKTVASTSTTTHSIQCKWQSNIVNRKVYSSHRTNNIKPFAYIKAQLHFSYCVKVINHETFDWLPDILCSDFHDSTSSWSKF